MDLAHLTQSCEYLLRYVQQGAVTFPPQGELQNARKRRKKAVLSSIGELQNARKSKTEGGGF